MKTYIETRTDNELINIYKELFFSLFIGDENAAEGLVEVIKEMKFRDIVL